MKKLQAYILPAIVITLLLPVAAEAQTLTNPLGTTNINVVIGRIVKALLGISGAIALLMFVWGGFQWLISQGSPDKVKKGKDTLIWASIGLAVIFAAYTLVSAVIAALSSGNVPNA